MTISLINKFSPSGLVESMQKVGLRFAFVKEVNSNTYETLHPTVKCRDYLKDLSLFLSIGKVYDISIFGFHFGRYNLKEIDQTCFLMAVTGSPREINILKLNGSLSFSITKSKS